MVKRKCVTFAWKDQFAKLFLHVSPCFVTYHFCSLSCRLGVANSDLLRCYMSLDPRVPQLVFIVRAWARAKGLTIGKQLSNYALTLMVLYFLQMRTPPVIPSLQQGFDSWIKELSCLHNTDDNDRHTLVAKQLESDVIDGWECSFFKDTHRLSMTRNDTSLSKYGCLGSLPVILIPSCFDTSQRPM